MDRKQLFQSWQRLLQIVGAQCDLLGTFRQLEDAYGEPQRHYHTLAHIDACLSEFLPAYELADEPSAVELAIWFHDIVYDIHRTDNEEESAYRALAFCENAGLQRYALSVQRMILATKHATPTTNWTVDTALLVDVDLSILGQREAVFDHYEHQIRREYDWVVEAVFRERRAQLLESFLARSTIYQTDFFRDKYEGQARHNLARSIAQLREG